MHRSTPWLLPKANHRVDIDSCIPEGKSELETSYRDPKNWGHFENISVLLPLEYIKIHTTV